MFQPLDHQVRQVGLGAVLPVLEGVPPVGGTQDGPSLGQNLFHPLGRQRDHSIILDDPFIALFDSYKFPSITVNSGQDQGPYNGVQAGAVSAAGGDGDFIHSSPSRRFKKPEGSFIQNNR